MKLWLRFRLSITTKMLGGCAFVLALLLVVAFVGWRSTAMLANSLRAVSQDNLQGAADLASAQQALYELRFELPNFMIADSQGQAAILADRPKWSKQVDDSIQAYRAIAHTPAELQGLQAWDQAYGQYVQDAPRFFTLFQAGQKDEALAWRTQHTNPAAAQAVTALTKLIDVQRQIAQARQQQTSSMAGQMQWILLAATLVAIAVSGTATYVVARGMTRNVRKVVHVSQSIVSEDLPDFERALQLLSRGDLTQEVAIQTVPVEITSSDEIRALADDFNAVVDGLRRLGAAYSSMRDGLRDIVGQVRHSAASLADASKQLDLTTNQSGAAVQQVADAIQQVAAGTQDTSRSAEATNEAVKQLVQAVDSIARGATDQARQVQAASDLVTQMAAGTKDVAGSAQNVAGSSERTKAVAESGSKAVQDTVGGMADIRSVVTQAASKVKELGRLSEKIGAVVETIDDIAEQTNLLALNAAIEAARAGEHGLGFAVVADEVRKLAERSQHETKAIAELIAQVQHGTSEAVQAMEIGSAKVEEGTAKADQAGHALQEILEAVDATVSQASTIADSAQQMAVSSASVMTVMQEISVVVEQNTAATEEMAAQSSQVLDAIQAIADASVQQSATTEQVSASALEMSAHVEEVNAEAAALAETAEALAALVARFKLPEEPGADSPNFKLLPLAKKADGFDVLLNSQLESAITAHAKWKLRLKHAIEVGSSDAVPEKVRLDNQCDFGKFLYGDIPATAKRDAHYTNIKDLHAKFHLQAAKVLERALAGNKLAAEEALATGGDYQRISSRLVREIMSWQKALSVTQDSDGSGAPGGNGKASRTREASLIG